MRIMRTNVMRIALLIIGVSCSCSPVPINEHNDDTIGDESESEFIYSTGNGTSSWIIRDNNFIALDSGRPLSEPSPTVHQFIEEGTSCIALDEVMVFGAPRVLTEGSEFRCGEARFSVTSCDYPEDCKAALIRGSWRSGPPGSYVNIPVNYFYDRCFGILSITFYPIDSEKMVQFGSSLESRGDGGMLENLDSEGCAPIGYDIEGSN